MTTVLEIIEARKGQYLVVYECDNCGKVQQSKKSHFDRKKRRYCSMACYAEHRATAWEPSEQPTWLGGVSSTESHRRWKAKNPKRMAHLKARYYAKRKDAKGGHSYEEWSKLLSDHDNRCVFCGTQESITKDHIVPLSEGGSDYITNIQPLCRSCNSRKWKKLNYIHENPELLEDA